MKITIKPKGYPKKEFQTHFETEPETPDRIEATVEIESGGFVFLTFRNDRDPDVYFQVKSETAKDVLPYLSPLYEQIKKHCETWLAYTAEPFPWESKEEFTQN